MAEIEFPDGYLVIMIKRGDDVVIPVGSTIIEKKKMMSLCWFQNKNIIFKKNHII